VSAQYERLTVGGVVTATSYYYLGGQRVAMRQGGSLYWLHGDHLGSASLTTSITGTKLSEQRYYPFGQVRIPGTLPSDRTFTGQRAESVSTVGSLMDYGARFYSPLLGRFISADSIVPRPGDPQSLNRYTYVRNSPLTRVDPTGHVDLGCKDGDNSCWINQWTWNNRWYQAQQTKRQNILEFGLSLKDNKGLTSLEMFASLTDYASALYDVDDTYNFMLDLSYIILGWSRSQRMFEVTDNLGKDWLRQNAFPDWSGWSAQYNDYDAKTGPHNNQMFHFWFYAAVAYFDGPVVALLGNIYHEIPTSRDDRTQGLPTGEWAFALNPRLINGGRGNSKQDYALGLRGVELGWALSPQGASIRLGGVGDWLRTNLGEKKP
jgi:RHS repeat-associated protein